VSGADLRPGPEEDDMKYVILIHSNPAAWEALPEGEANRVLGQHMTLIDEMTKSGELVTQFGLEDASKTKTLRVDTGAPVITDGPYIESKEQLAGVFVVDSASEDRVQEIAAILAQHSVVEIRPMYLGDGTEG
jgi:hypothetical protein